MLKKEQKQPHDHEKNSTAEKKEKAVCVATKESDSLTPVVDSVTLSFFFFPQREIPRALLLDT